MDEQINQEGWDKVYQETYKQIREALAAGRTVLYDTGNFTKYERRLVSKIAIELRLPFKTIYLNVPVEVARERWLKNKETKGRFGISKEAFESAAKEIETPLADENVYEFKMNDNPKDLIRRIKTDLL